MRKLALAVMLVFSATVMAYSGTLHPDLIQKLNESQDDELIRVMVTMEAQADFQQLVDATANLTKPEIREFVVTYLQDLALTTQQDVKDYLESFESSGKVKKLQSVSIVNMLHCMAVPEVLRDMEGFPGVMWVRLDPERFMLFDRKVDENNHPGLDATDEIAWGVSDINADDVWLMGYNGSGAIVGVVDTGVNYNHMDLADHMWDGGAAYPNHGWDFYNNDNDPMDDGSWFGGHGTHCSGSVASDGTAGSQCGVAPNASIMAVKVLSGNGYGSEGPVISGIDFAVQEGADIFSMSLGWQSTSQKYEFRTACNNALAAGVIGAIAAGNEGDALGSYPVPGNVRTPGDVPPPWLNPDQALTGGLSCVVTVGATNSSHTIASFSSHGPVTWENVNPWNDYAYSGGSQMGLIDPDVSAPGENIKSLNFQNIWGYSDGWSGTSMATPHVAGTMALMLSKNPSLTPADICMYLENTALDWGSAGKDNIYGAGRIDALAAVSAVPGGTIPDVDFTIDPTGSTSLPASGGTLYFDVNLSNNEATPTYVAAWLEWTYPSGGSSGTLVLRNLNLSPGGNIARSLWLSVSRSEPDGNYTLWARAGSSYGGTIYAEDSFPFSKGLDNASPGEWISQTKLFGWDDDEGTAIAGRGNLAPTEFALLGAYPNPFNPETAISYQLSAVSLVNLTVYDVNGRLVTELVNGWRDAGVHEVVFDGSGLASGIYLYRLQLSGSGATPTTATGKMVLMK